jgi:hypothetical protein
MTQTPPGQNVSLKPNCNIDSLEEIEYLNKSLKTIAITQNHGTRKAEIEICESRRDSYVSIYTSRSDSGSIAVAVHIKILAGKQIIRLRIAESWKSRNNRFSV